MSPASPIRTAPLTFMQEEIWVSQQLAPESPAYNVIISIHINQDLNLAALEKALNILIERHETLRTLFRCENGEPVQIITQAVPHSIQFIDLRSSPAGSRNDEAISFIAGEAKKPISLSEPSLLRSIVVQLDEKKYKYFLLIHHVIIDAYALFQVLLPQIRATYDAITSSGGPPPEPEEGTPQFADYAIHERETRTGDWLAGELEFWKERLASLDSIAALPLDYPRPIKLSGWGKLHTEIIPQATIANLRGVAAKAKCSLFTTLLSAFGILLRRWTGSNDVLFETVIGDRNDADKKAIIGPMVNTVALRLQLSGKETVIQLLSHVAAEISRLKHHAHMPFDMTLRALQSQRHSKASLPFHAIMNRSPLQDCGDWHATSYEVHNGTSKFDLAIEFEATPDGWLMQVEYSTDIFKPSTISKLTGHYQSILESMCSSPDAYIDSLNMLTPGESDVLNAFTVAPSREDTQLPFFHELVEHHAARSPDSIAVIAGTQSITYGTLNQQAIRFAHSLSKSGIGLESRVAVLLEKSVGSVIAMLAILKTGAAYVPLDPAHPDARINFILNDAAPERIIAGSKTAQRLAGHKDKLVILEEHGETFDPHTHQTPFPTLRPQNLAYIIYTSGTSGNPKGVAVEHRGLSNLIAASDRVFHFKPEDRILQFASPSFDASIWEYTFGLTSGAAVVLWDPKLSTANRSLADHIHEMKVTAALLTPTVLASIPHNADHLLSGIHTLISGGEPCTIPIIQRWAPNRRFFNAYGPTEITVCATMAQCTPSDARVSIGQPLDGVECYVADLSGNMAALGLPGELCIGGSGVARGYLQKADLTAERFIPNPYRSGQGKRIYKTGDLVRWTENKQLEYIGRIDTQIKLHGVRIELGEIESVLASHPLIRSAATVLVESSPIGPYIHGFAVRQSRAPGSADKSDMELTREVRAWLRSKLPEAMVPTAIDIIDELPTTTSGKIDRSTLRTRAIFVRRTAPTSIPATETERILASIWGKLLDTSELDVNESFFDLGGNSLMIIQAQMAIKTQLGQDIPILDFFRYPSIRALGAHLTANEAPHTDDLQNKLRAQRQREARTVQAKRWQSKRNK